MVKRRVEAGRPRMRLFGSQSRLSWTTGNDRRGELEVIQRCSRIRAAPGDEGDDPESIIRDF